MLGFADQNRIERKTGLNIGQGIVEVIKNLC